MVLNSSAWLLLGIIISGTQGVDWNGNNWAFACDFVGNDLSHVRSTGKECGGKCAATPGCTHFAWTGFNGGTCWLKGGKVSRTNAIDRGDRSNVCGIVGEAGGSTSPGGIDWKGNNWALGCDFVNRDLSNAQSRGEECGGKCAATAGCTHFTWTGFNGGTCWMKSGPVSKNDAVATSDKSSVCGVINSGPGLRCNDNKIRGVNAGGWLVLEPWMTPTLFEDFNRVASGYCKDEYTAAQYVPRNYYQERLRQHWDTFYSKHEFSTLQNSGISHVRIPVAYWYWDVAGDEPFPAPNMNDDDPNSPLFYLKRMLGWLEELDMIAMIDLHTAPGSQNGFDNSGRDGKPNWVQWGQVGRTKDILRKLVGTLRDWVDRGVIQQRTLYGFCLLNEPAGWLEEIWQACRDDYYPNGYGIVREAFPGRDVVVNLQQAFKDGWMFDDYMTEPGFSSVSIDMHTYQCFGDYWNNVHNDPAGMGAHYDASCAYALEVAQRKHWTFSGEWSLGNAGPWNWNDPIYTNFLRTWFLAQIDAYEYGSNGIGWFFWNMKVERGYEEWNYLLLLERGIVPSNLCKRDHFCIFNTDRKGRLMSTSYNRTMARI